MADEADLRHRVASEPGDPAFAELAELLRERGDLEEATELCLRGLSANPSCHRARLTLARVFYQREFFPFAIKELEQLSATFPQNRSLTKLLARLSPRSESTEAAADSEQIAAETVAEAEFDFDEIDLIGDEE